MNDFIPSTKSLDNITKINHDENKDENFLHILSHTYHFPEITINPKRETKQNKKKLKTYFKAINFYMKNINKRDDQRINSVTPIDKTESPL